MDALTDFLSLGFTITVGGDCSHESKTTTKTFAPWKDHILKNRDITLPTKVHIVKALVFPVVMYKCKSWPIKKAESQKIDAFELWCWRSPLDCKAIKPVHPKGNQS